MNKTEILNSAKRLEKAITEHYGTQTKFAEQTNIATQTISDYVSGKRAVSNKMAEKIEAETGISSKWILKGVEPIRLFAPSVKTSSVLASAQTNTTTKRGICAHYILDNAGNHTFLTYTGEANVADIAFNGIKNPMMIRVVWEEFKKKYNYNGVVTLVVGEEYNSGNVVLVRNNLEYYLATCDKDEYFDKSDGQKISKNNLEIIGTLFCRIVID